MTNFDLLKLDISKCKTPEEMDEVEVLMLTIKAMDSYDSVDNF